MIKLIAGFVIHLALAGNPHLPDGPPSIGCWILPRTGYVTCVNHETKVADWTCYTLRPEYSECSQKRGNWFKADKDLPGWLRVPPTCYGRTGYDRGHLCAYKDSCDTMEKARQTFLMSNMAPQKPCLNRQHWKRLEAEVRQMALEYGEVHVCTGPVWKSSLLGKLDCGAWIPHAFWKITTTDANRYAFLLDNDCYADEGVYDFVVDVSEIEDLTGLKF